MTMTNYESDYYFNLTHIYRAHEQIKHVYVQTT